ncbi:MAG: hypothetical protein J4G13_01730 [Dehalococcoidia bacterium]|nr:hypothetical protein [Dehalococcoidia bacterium]
MVSQRPEQLGVAFANFYTQLAELPVYLIPMTAAIKPAMISPMTPMIATTIASFISENSLDTLL